MNFFETAVIVMISCLLAGIVQSSAGLGYTIVTAGLLPLFIPYTSATIIALITVVSVLCMTCYKFRESINFHVLVLPVAVSLFGRSISLWILIRTNNQYMMKLSGIFLVFISIYLITFADKIYLKPSKINGSIIGLAAGILGGLTNISGPIFTIYYLPLSKSRDEFSGTLQFSFLSGCIFSLIVHLIHGNITTEMWELGIIGSIAAIIGALLGLKIYSRMNQKFLRKLICGVIAVMGCMQLLK